MKPPIITCPHCTGCGIVKLRGAHLETLTRLNNSMEGQATTDDLIEPGIARTAINNRLVALERMGLVHRKGKKSKSIVWKIGARLIGPRIP